MIIGRAMGEWLHFRQCTAGVCKARGKSLGPNKVKVSMSEQYHYFTRLKRQCLSIKRQISGQSTRMVKGCMDLMFDIGNIAEYFDK